MIRGIYTVRDESSTLFMSLQLNENDATAIRSFDYALASNDLMRFSPETFSLWKVGLYDDTTGVIDACDPVCVKRGVKRGKK